MKQEQENITLSSFLANKTTLQSCLKWEIKKHNTALSCHQEWESLQQLDMNTLAGVLDKEEMLPSTLVMHLEATLKAFTTKCSVEPSPDQLVKQLIASILAMVLLMKPTATSAWLLPWKRTEMAKLSRHSKRTRKQFVADAKFQLPNSTPAFHPSSSGWLMSKPANEHEHPTSLTAQTDDHLLDHAKLEVSNF